MTTRREELERTERRLQWAVPPGFAAFWIVDVFVPDNVSRWLLAVVWLVAIGPLFVAWLVVLWRLRQAKADGRDGAPYPGG